MGVADTKMELLELDEDRIVLRIGYCFKTWRVFLVEGLGYIGAVEIITPGRGSFGQSGRAVMVIQNFVAFCRNGHTVDAVPGEYLVGRLTNARVTDEDILVRIRKMLAVWRERVGV